jgi:DNA-binding CsgD family transcriptional regulator
MIQAEKAFPSKDFAEQFLGVITSVMPLSSCCFYRVNGDRHVLDHQLVNLSPYWKQRYYHHFWRLDPLHPRRVSGSTSRLQVLTQETIRRDAEALEYWEQFLKPQNTAYQTELYFWLGSKIVAGASLLRSHSEGAFSEQNIAFLEKFVNFTEHNLFQQHNDDDNDWHGFADMTPREREIASLVGEAMSNKEIGRRLNIELPTVKAHVSRVLAKAGAQSRAEFIKKLQSR